MNEDIRFWRGKRIEQLSVEELRMALAEVYRDVERLSWQVHSQAKTLDALQKKKRGKVKLELVVDEPDELQEEDIAA